MVLTQSAALHTFIPMISIARTLRLTDPAVLTAGRFDVFAT
jgi:hypothetical protein